MARRRYRSDAISGAGHGERPPDPAPSEQLPLGSEPPSPSAPAPDQAEPEPAQHFSTGLGDQLRQQRLYVQQHQPQQQIDPLAAYLASIPGLTIPKFHFLYHYFAQHPDRLNPQHWELLKGAHRIAREERDIPEDSPEYFGFLHQLLQQHAASPPAMPPPVAHVDQTEAPDDGETEVSMAAHHISAPVSRGAEHYAAMSDDYEPGSNSRVTLSKAEREHAHAAGVSDEVYAREKLRFVIVQSIEVNQKLHVMIESEQRVFVQRMKGSEKNP